MKTNPIPLCAAFVGSQFFTGTCQALTPVTENFKTAALNTKVWKLANFKNARLSQSNGRLNFTVSPKTDPGGEDYSYLELRNNQPGFNESWQVIVDVANTIGKGDTMGVGFWIFNADDPGDTIYMEFHGKGNPVDNGFNAAFVLDGKYLDASLWKNPKVTAGSMRVTFSKQTKLFTFFYDSTGSANGYKWVKLGTFSPTRTGGDVRADWQMNPGSGRFGIRLEGYGEKQLVPNGKAFMDNFVLKAL